MPEKMKDFHQILNTILLGIVGFFSIQTYLKIDGDHEKINDHEVRIGILEDRNQRHAELFFPKIFATLPENLEIKEE